MYNTRTLYVYFRLAPYKPSPGWLLTHRLVCACMKQADKDYYVYITNNIAIQLRGLELCEP